MIMGKQGNSGNAKSPWRFFFWGCIAYGALSLLGDLTGYLLTWMLAVKTGSSRTATIGIIGGADGPTAVFITTPPWTACILPVLALAAGISGLVWLRRKQRVDA